MNLASYIVLYFAIGVILGIVIAALCLLEDDDDFESAGKLLILSLFVWPLLLFLIAIFAIVDFIAKQIRRRRKGNETWPEI